MKRTLIRPDLADFPEIFHPLLQNSPVYDSSCSKAARVWFLDTDGGFYLKSAPAGTLKAEAKMTAYFHSKGLGAEVLGYRQDDRDWLLTRAIPGEDCVFPMYLEDPKRLSETLGLLLRQLHSVDISDCPVDRTASYFADARRMYESGHYDTSLYPDNWGYRCAEDAWKVIEENARFLKRDVLLHGDYCLPNVMLDNWRFSGFIDLGNSGMADRHIDLFWGVWTLGFNLKTDAYGDRFLDAYGREDVEKEMFRIIAAFECFG